MVDSKRFWHWKDNQYYGEEDSSVRECQCSHPISNNHLFSYDCDEFTKAFYHHNFGVTDFTPVTVEAPKAQALEKVCHIMWYALMMG